MQSNSLKQIRLSQLRNLLVVPLHLGLVSSYTLNLMLRQQCNVSLTGLSACNLMEPNHPLFYFPLCMLWMLCSPLTNHCFSLLLNQCIEVYLFLVREFIHVICRHIHQSLTLTVESQLSTEVLVLHITEFGSTPAVVIVLVPLWLLKLVRNFWGCLWSFC